MAKGNGYEIFHNGGIVVLGDKDSSCLVDLRLEMTSFKLANNNITKFRTI